MSDTNRTASSLDSVHNRCLAGVASVLTMLNLDEIGDQIEQGEMQPSERNAKFPCIFVTPDGDPEVIEDDMTTFETDATAYPVNVLLADHSSQRDADRVPAYTGWRRQCMREFRKLVKLPGVNECYNITVAPKAVFDPSVPKYQYVVSGFQVQCHCEEARKGRERR